MLNNINYKRLLSILMVMFSSFFYLKWQGVSWFNSTLVSLLSLVVLLIIWALEYRLYPEKEKIKGKSASFDWGMHYLRGFAIVCIMVMHILTRFDLHPITHAFFSSSTVFFLFISGYLCQYLALKRPLVDVVYYKKKAQNVILPYIIMSILTIVLLCLIGEPRVGLVKPNFISWGKIPELLILGKAQPQYWYIPFVTVLFIVSPFLTRLSTKALVWFTLVAFVCAIVFPSRGGSTLKFSVTVIGSKYTFFSFYYLIGFLYARLKTSVDPHLKSYAIPAFLFAVLLGIGMLEPSLFGKAVLKGGFACSFQKLLFLVPILLIAIALKNKKNIVLDALAEYSFALYFIHYFFIHDWVRIQNWIHNLIPCVPNGLLILIDLLLIILYVAQNLIWAIICKNALGKCSRSVFGA